MDATYRKERSLNGYPIDVLKSCLQKSVRRSVLSDAVYAAGELDLFSRLGKPGQRIRSNFIHRLMIIFCEDVGPAAIDDWPEVDKCIFKWLKAQTEEEHELLICRILKLLNQRKRHRATSHWMRDRYDDIDISWIYDCDSESKAAWLKWKFAGLTTDNDRREYMAVALNVFEECPRLINKLFLCPKNGLLTMHKDSRIRILGEIAVRWYRELNTEKEHVWMLVLLTSWYNFKSVSVSSDVSEDIEYTYDRNRRKETIEIPSYVFDKHTRKKVEKKEGEKPGWYVCPESDVALEEGTIHNKLKKQFDANSILW